ncbi:Endonuclease, Uma2 family (restriction endonuclease fold) [Lachnospiraceae bacterium YSD2013]|nr:Endonuclease, Uma2 family (restriction endonuclease fold) [Lachnospiraceae bacterium YSD2013]
MIATLYEPFRHWSETGSVYILSDLHLADSNCQLIASDWVSPEEQIDIINRTVMKNDTFVCLGDVGNPKYIPMIKARKKILLLGNHDPKGAYKEYFDEVYAGPLFIAPQILLSHEPVHGLPWCLNIHGHDHNNAESYVEGCKHINLAADMCDYTPLNLGKIIKEGVLSDIDSIHRITIDRAIKRKKGKNLLETVKSMEEHAELINGKIVITKSVTLAHYSAVHAIADALDKNVKSGSKVFRTSIGLYCNEILGDDSNFFLPDVMVVDEDAKVDNDGVHSAPTFVAEVTSESTGKFNHTQKMFIYREIGVKEYWVVDVVRKKIVRYLADNDLIPEIYDFQDTESLSLVTYPNVEIKLSDIFPA